MGSPGLRYSLLRILLFLGCLIALWLVGLRSLTLVVVAGLVSMVVSLWTLRGPRDDFAARLQQRVDARAARAEQRGATRVSDEDMEEAELAQGRPARPDAAEDH